MKNSIFVLIVLFCTGIFGCDILWHDDLHERLEAETSATIHFYSNREEALAASETLSTAEKSYKIGETISAADLPLHTDSRSAQWIRDLKVGGWRFYRWTSHKETSDTPVFTVDENNIITSLKIPADEIDVYAVYMAAYTVVKKVQNTDGTTYTEERKTESGEVGTQTCVTAEEIEGFESPVFEDKTIAGDGSTVVEIVYNRKTITITLEAGDGAFDGGAKTKTLSGLYEAPVSDGGITPFLSDEKPFARWNPPLPETYPKEDMTSTAVYKGQEYNITYYDAYGKTFSGKEDALPTMYKYGETCSVPKPETAVSAAENTVEFAGWFKKDDDAQTEVKLDEDGSGWYISDTTAGDLSLYAKWKMQNVYVNPESGDNSSGNGLSPASPLKTIAEAQKYLPDSLETPSVKVMSAISAAEDVTYLSGLTTPAYNNAVLQPAQGYTGTLIIAGGASGAAALSNLTIDGGSQPFTAPPIVVSGGNLSLGSGVSITHCTINSGVHGVVQVSGVSQLTLDGCEISGNTGDYSVYYESSTAAVYMQGATKIDPATPIYISTGCAVSVAGALTQNPAAKLYAAEYKAQPTVLTGDAMLVSANYGKFAVSHEGYYINANGKLIANSSGGGIGSEKHECTFSLVLSPDMMTGGQDKTLTVNATVTAHGADKVLNPLADSAWKDVSIKVLCGSSEAPGVTIAGGTITIPAGAKAETYRITISGTYTCGECGSTEHFDSELGFVIEPPDVYVSPHGDDTEGDGTQAKPFATLQKAFDVIKSHNDGTLSYTVHILGTLAGKSELAADTAAQKIFITGTAGVELLNNIHTVGCTAPIEITNITIKNASNFGLRVKDGANVTLGEGAVVSRCSRGGVWIENGGTLTMKRGAKISENENDVSNSKIGGGVGNNGTFIMEGGEISGNRTSPSDIHGGGVYSTGTFIMKGGIISGNNTSTTYSAPGGGGVCINGGTFTMEDGTISGNAASSEGKGGGVYVKSGSFTMTGGIISGNTAKLGGGVYNVGTFTMESDAEISGNTPDQVYNAP